MKTLIQMKTMMKQSMKIIRNEELRFTSQTFGATSQQKHAGAKAEKI